MQILPVLLLHVAVAFRILHCVLRMWQIRAYLRVCFSILKVAPCFLKSCTPLNAVGFPAFLAKMFFH